MNPFYEQQKRNLRTAILDTLTFPEHLHAHTEFLYVMEGQTRVSVGNTSYDMKQGDCALIFPGLVHSYHASEPNRVWLLIFDTGVTASFQYLLQKFRPTCPYLPADQVSPDIALAVSRLDDMNMEEIRRSPPHGSRSSSDMYCRTWSLPKKNSQKVRISLTS